MARRKQKLLKQRHTLKFFVPGLREPMVLKIPMSDATSEVELHREVIDLKNGIRGTAVECMNAQCGLRLARAFSHPVFLVEFTDTRAFVVDKLNRQGMPVHCVRYYHHEGDEQREFDKKGGKQKLVRSGKAKKTFKLL